MFAVLRSSIASSLLNVAFMGFTYSVAFLVFVAGVVSGVFPSTFPIIAGCPTNVKGYAKIFLNSLGVL